MMKKNYAPTIIIFLIMFFVGIYKVNAAVYSDNIFNPSSNQDSTYFDVSGRSYTLHFGNTIFNNKGTGTIIFNVVQASTGGTTNVVYTYEIGGTNASYTCSSTGGTWYVDNDTQRFIQTISCPYNSDYDNGAKYLYVHRDSNSGTTRIYIPYHFTFVTDDETDVSAIVNGLDDLSDTLVSTLNGNTNSILASLSSLWSKSESNTQSIINRLEIIKTFLSSISSSGTTIHNDITSQSEQQHQDAQQAHQDAQDINNSINNDNVDSASSSASSWNNKNASNGVITQLLTLPITLLNAIVSGIQTSCSNFNLGNLFGTDIILPCINLSSLIGSTLFTTIDLLISGFMIYNISKKLIKIFNDFTNLKSNQIDEIYGGGNN